MNRSRHGDDKCRSFHRHGDGRRDSGTQVATGPSAVRTTDVPRKPRNEYASPTEAREYAARCTDNPRSQVILASYFVHTRGDDNGRHMRETAQALRNSPDATVSRLFN
jgi:hypothetical protein